MLPGNSPDIFLDTDVAFDIISKRKPHFDSSFRFIQMAAEGKVRLMISEASLATLFYLSFDIYKIRDAAARLSDFVNACELLPSGRQVVLDALRSPFRDKEDALQFYTAPHAKADYFITRNKKDYKVKDPSLPVYLPLEFPGEAGI